MSSRVIGFELIGSVGPRALETIERSLTSFLESCDRPAHLFWDCDRLDSLDGNLRDNVVDLLQMYRPRWSTAHVLFQKTLIGVTVSAINLAVGGSVKAYRYRPLFRAAVEQALRNRISSSI
ncbi:MAG: hypothetical protein AAGF11_55070 [Myxococcota bacterium]